MGCLSWIGIKDYRLNCWQHKITSKTGKLSVIASTRSLGLQAGYIKAGTWEPTSSGTPQGGIVSPTLLNITLSGLEQAIMSASTNLRRDKLHIVIYADDFIITGNIKEILETQVRPRVEAFLGERGLTLSESKTKITPIKEGFNFLGWNFRKYQEGKLIRKPAKENVKRFLAAIRNTIKANKTAKTENLIRLLNPKIRGWTNYHRHSCASKTYHYVSHQIFEAIWQWAKRRHTNKGRKWIKNRYFRTMGSRHWVFSAQVKSKDNQPAILRLLAQHEFILNVILKL